MGELFQSSLPVQGAVVAVAFLLCLAPHLGKRNLVAVLGVLPFWLGSRQAGAATS